MSSLQQSPIDQLVDAAAVGVTELESVLKDYPDVDINGVNSFGLTALHNSTGQPEVVKLLLSHPNINVNPTIYLHFIPTPLARACWFNHMPAIRLLLDDKRVDASYALDGKNTPLCLVVNREHHEAGKWLIASGKYLGDVPKAWPNFYLPARTSLKTIENHEHFEFISLLKSFAKDPEGTRRQVQIELGFRKILSVELFATAIFLCDGLLQIRLLVSEATRFWAIMSKLPMELQMILSYRACGLANECILTQESEPAFRSLAKALLLEK